MATNFKKKLYTIAVSTPDYLNRYRTGYTLILTMWTVKNEFEADPINLDRKVVRFSGLK